jgi:hypothetical protein
MAQQAADLAAGIRLIQSALHCPVQVVLGEEVAEAMQPQAGDVQFVTGAAQLLLQAGGEALPTPPQPVPVAGDTGERGLQRGVALGVRRRQRNDAGLAALGAVALNVDGRAVPVQIRFLEQGQFHVAQAGGP